MAKVKTSVTINRDKGRATAVRQFPPVPTNVFIGGVRCRVGLVEVATAALPAGPKPGRRRKRRR